MLRQVAADQSADRSAHSIKSPAASNTDGRAYVTHAQTPKSGLSEALLVFNRVDESLDHLGSLEVAIELVQLSQPEVVASMVDIRRGVRVASQIAKILGQHKCPVSFRSKQAGMFSDCAQNLGSSLSAA